MIFKTTKKTLDQATQTPQKNGDYLGYLFLLASTAGDTSFLRKTGDYLGCLFLLLATEVFSEKRGLSQVLISTAGHRSFLRKTGIISGAYFYCWRHKFSQKNRDYLGCLFLLLAAQVFSGKHKLRLYTLYFPFTIFQFEEVYFCYR